jgi:hypothetical protein
MIQRGGELRLFAMPR